MLLKYLFVILSFSVILTNCYDENILLICKRNNRKTPIGYNIKSNKNAKYYYLCNTNKLPILKECPNNLLFNSETGFCDISNFNRTKNINSINSKRLTINKNYCKINGGASLIVIPNNYQYNNGKLNENEYLKCVSGKLNKFRCPSNLIFNKNTGFCDSNVAFDTNKKYCTHNNFNIPKSYSVTLNKYSTNEYLYCDKHGLLYKNKCNGNIYNYNANNGFCDLKTTTNQNINNNFYFENCPEFNLNHNDIVFDPQSCKRFYQCIDGEMVSKMCYSNLIFDPVRKDCLPITDHQQFCTNDMFEMCDKVPGKYQIFDNDRGSSDFIICDQHEPKRQTCQSGMFFNHKTGFCDLLFNIEFDTGLLDVEMDFIVNTDTPEVEKMDEQRHVKKVKVIEETLVETITSCKGQANGVTFQTDRTKCDQYVMCEYGMTHNIMCPPGLVYSRSSGSCEFIRSTDCTSKNNSTLCQYYPDGYILKKADSCSDYYYCDFGDLVTRKCPDDFVFNPKIASCDWKENYECSLHADIEDGGRRIGKSMSADTFIANNTDCSLSDLCPYGLFYKQITNVCDFC